MAICEREGLLSDHFVCTCQSPFTGFNCPGMTCNKIFDMHDRQVCKLYKSKMYDFINTDGIVQHNNIIISDDQL